MGTLNKIFNILINNKLPYFFSGDELPPIICK